MSQISKSSYDATYAGAAGSFQDNSTRNITPSVMRTYSADQKDSFMFIIDHAYESWQATASGTDTYTATLTPAITAYADGQRFRIKFTNANTGAATLNLNGLGAKSIRKNGTTTLSAGDINAGQVLDLQYDGTNLQIVGGGGGSGSTIVAWKEPVKAATTGNITLSGTQTIDGVSCVATDRVLVKDQSTQTQNGIYLCAVGAWSRASDADSASELEGAAVIVQQGNTNADTVWIQTTDSITLGSSNIAWSKINTSVANASTTVAGVVEKATQSELDAGTATGGTGAQLFVGPAEARNFLMRYTFVGFSQNL